MVRNLGVHITHCCVYHGCKYAEPDCPVWSGEVEQKYDCEQCEYEDRMPILNYLNKRLNEVPLSNVETWTELARAKEFVIAEMRGDHGWHPDTESDGD